MITVFEYIYDNDPDGAIALCNHYKVPVNSDDDVINALREIALDSKQGFADVLQLHPEKEVIIENCLPEGYEKCHNDGQAGNCKNCNLSRLLLNSYNANGSASNMQPYTVPQPQNNNQQNGLSAALMQTNTLIVIGIISLIGVGIYIHSQNQK